MSLDSLFKQNNKKKNDTEIADDQVSGEFRSRAEEESLAASESSGRGKASKANKRPVNSRKNSPDEVALPEKKRARRRLIGAVALVLAAIITLPMVFDSEPKPGSQKISIEIPSKDTPLVSTNPVRNANSPATAIEPGNEAAISQGIDKAEEIVAAPVPAAPAVAAKATVAPKVEDARNVVKVESATAQKTSEKNSEKNTEKKIESSAVNKTTLPSTLPPTPTSNKVVQESAKKVDARPEPKALAKVDAKTKVDADIKKENKNDAERALALLEGRTPSSDEAKSATKLTSTATPSSTGAYTLQIAALNSPEKIRELQSKLKAASINSYTQKITTKNGEVSRIRVGPFANKAEAEKMRAKLVKLGLNGSLLPN
ncbi:SPOR domain-containing protein [Undibacterium danionis]|uniref:SPOR domain-containing protein n=1 Tax=Undibacterium danionis TaxID=1812100 RepID=A0ABV6IFU9_9BURK